MNSFTCPIASSEFSFASSFHSTVIEYVLSITKVCFHIRRYKISRSLFFSLVYLTTSSLVKDERVRKTLLISAIGMAVLVDSNEVTPIQYHVYPPYGIITMAFLPLGTNLLFVGNFLSAKNIAITSDIVRAKHLIHIFLVII